MAVIQVQVPTVALPAQDAPPCHPTMVKSLISSKRHVHFEEVLTFMDEEDDCENDNNDAMEVEYEEEDEGETFEPCSWYTQKEYNDFRAHNLLMLQYGRQEGYINNAEWTSRGFEYVVQQYPRKQVRVEHVRRVLHFQQVLDVDCPSALADYASNSSYNCQGRARAMGETDEQEAFAIHQQCPEYIRNNKMSRSIARTTSEQQRSTMNPVSVGGSWPTTMLKFFRCI